MAEIKVLSRTQRIIVDPSNRSVMVVNAGPIGPAGPPGVSEAGSASGTVNNTLVWTLNHNLKSFPAGIKFYTLDEEYELEPEQIVWVSEDRILAVWPEPMSGIWRVS